MICDASDHECRPRWLKRQCPHHPSRLFVWMKCEMDAGKKHDDASLDARTQSMAHARPHL
ncbi:hypothetical protein BDR03DRAFT_946372 [Suillus americanus]|nr:hypothetical protein BDR03DRAFT_946372 [Suillus americanus]